MAKDGNDQGHDEDEGTSSRPESAEDLLRSIDGDLDRAGGAEPANGHSSRGGSAVPVGQDEAGDGGDDGPVDNEPILRALGLASPGGGGYGSGSFGSYTPSPPGAYGGGAAPAPPAAGSPPPGDEWREEVRREVRMAEAQKREQEDHDTFLVNRELRLLQDEANEYMTRVASLVHNNQVGVNEVFSTVERMADSQAETVAMLREMMSFNQTLAQSLFETNRSLNDRMANLERRLEVYEESMLDIPRTAHLGGGGAARPGPGERERPAFDRGQFDRAAGESRSREARRETPAPRRPVSPPRERPAATTDFFGSGLPAAPAAPPATDRRDPSPERPRPRSPVGRDYGERGSSYRPWEDTAPKGTGAAASNGAPPSPSSTFWDDHDITAGRQDDPFHTGPTAPAAPERPDRGGSRNGSEPPVPEKKGDAWYSW